MPEFFVTCPRGLASALEAELVSFDLKLKSLRSKPSGVHFESSWAKAYEVNLRSKVASRVVKPVLDYDAPTEDHIAPQLKKHDFSKYIPQGGSFALRVKLSDRSKYKDQRFVMNRIRVGLMEQFEKAGRPDINVSKENPHLEIFVGVSGVTFSYSLNMSGAPLSHRGYRKTERAPLRENLAAGLLKLTEWKPSEPLVDFMCGSGTFLIEAATLEKPSSLTRGYAFEKWSQLDSVSWEGIKRKHASISKRRTSKQIFGFDQDPRSIESLYQTLKEENLTSVVTCKQMAVKDLSVNSLNLKPGVVILNPPYGERLGEKEQLKKVYSLIGQKLKSEFQGWRAYVLSSNSELVQELKLKSFCKFKVDNGGLPCAFLGYQVN